MSEDSRPFDDALISGYLDGELTQAEEQRVRLHLERDAEARKLFEDLARMRQAARGTRLKLPADEQWSELPRTVGSGLARNLGWGLLGLWLAGLVLFVLWQVGRSPAGLWLKLVVFAPASGFLLLLASALIDRLRVARTDRYRRVEK
ncbi:MAG TPA: zf-HC2 domain-containing protein [Thermoanaerobaculia bacterium]|nr:zf-HC2 domain-containing protein [Thermoanaerobaculia bacterium]